MAARILVIQFRLSEDARAEREPLARVLDGACELVFKNALAREVTWKAPEQETRGFSGVVLSGSAVLFFDGGHAETHEGRVMTSALAEEAKPFAQYLIEHDILTLGICFGHQLLGYASGAVVGHSRAESKTGTHAIVLTEAGKKDPLMKDVPVCFRAHYGHKDVLFDVPRGAVVLAHAGEKCRYSAVKFNKHVYGMQFHPEYSRQEITRVVTQFPEYIPQDVDVGELFEDTEEAEQILKNFASVASGAS